MGLDREFFDELDYVDERELVGKSKGSACVGRRAGCVSGLRRLFFALSGAGLGVLGLIVGWGMVF